MGARPALPDWPRLMSTDVAAQYLGISATTFRSLDVCPINIGSKPLWDRRSLDLYADRLAGQPLSEDDAARVAIEQERAFFARRNRG
ncbi:MAG TPA: hypothetical protein VF695_02930 [Sphingomonas sp.]|jgi:hypothetical protein